MLVHSGGEGPGEMAFLPELLLHFGDAKDKGVGVATRHRAKVEVRTSDERGMGGGGESCDGGGE